MTRILMHGCNGKMGQVISDLAKQMTQVEIVAGIDRYDGIKNSYPVFKALKECDVEVDVIIDFSNAAAVDELLDYAIEKKIPVVLCTTGLSEEQLEHVNEASKHTAILRSANMSLGVNTLLKLVQTAAKVLATAGFDMEIVERHHNQKVDAPSGTAIAFAEALNEAMNHSGKFVMNDLLSEGTICSLKGENLLDNKYYISDKMVDIFRTKPRRQYLKTQFYVYSLILIFLWGLQMLL